MCTWLLALGVISVWRAVVLWDVRVLLAELESRLSPALLHLFVGIGVACGIGLLASACGLWLRREWGRLAACVFVPCAYVNTQLYIWGFARSGLLWRRRWVMLVVAVCASAGTVAALTWHRSRKWLGLS
jgi:hypothetical protein